MKYDGTWALVEVMGHVRLAGQIHEEIVAGTTLLAVEVPAVGTTPAFTHLLGGGAIFRIVPLSEVEARAAAAEIRAVPVDPWLVGERSIRDHDAVPALRQLVAGNGGSSGGGGFRDLVHGEALRNESCEGIIAWDELVLEGETFLLPPGWGWEEACSVNLMPEDASNSDTTLYEAVQDEGEGQVFYDGINSLRVEGISPDDAGSVRRMVEAANAKEIARIRAAWASVDPATAPPAAVAEPEHEPPLDCYCMREGGPPKPDCQLCNGTGVEDIPF